jgi:GNAT superfamily N-acetyltransferase
VWRDGAKLMAEHCLDVGEPPDNYLNKNIRVFEKLADAGAWLIMTARCNGRMLGYLSSLVGPSLEDPKRITATQLSLFVARDAANINLAMRLERAAIERCRARGVSEVIMRAGVRGSGPRLGVIYKRLGAHDFGQLYHLDLEAA